MYMLFLREDLREDWILSSINKVIIIIIIIILNMLFIYSFSILLVEFTKNVSVCA